MFRIPRTLATDGDGAVLLHGFQKLVEAAVQALRVEDRVAVAPYPVCTKQLLEQRLSSDAEVASTKTG